MKVILLDIDGVLNTNTDFIEARVYGHPVNNLQEGKVIQRGKLAILEVLVKHTDARIVLSSTWRLKYNLDQIHEMFVERGWTLDRDILIDQTPNHSRGLSDNSYRHRGNEIKEWLNNQSDVESFVILDDKSEYILPAGFVEIEYTGDLGFYDDPVYVDKNWSGDLVITNENTGLTPTQGLQASFVLGRTESVHEATRERDRALALFI